MGNSILTKSTVFPASKSTIGEFNAVRNTLIELTEPLQIAFELPTRDKLFFSNLSIHSMHGVVEQPHQPHRIAIQHRLLHHQPRRCQDAQLYL